MSDPLSLVPFALAAAGGSIDAVPSHQLVAAGVTLLQRSASLVRALAGRQSALLLPPTAGWLVALAASDGRGALLLDPNDDADHIAEALVSHKVGAVFTVRALSDLLPSGTPKVWLDDAPTTARVLIGERDQTIDLGSHHGLALEGARDAEGRDEPCLLAVMADGATHPWTHRALLTAIRDRCATRGLTPLSASFAASSWRTVDAWIAECAAPLYVGATVRTR